MPRTDFDPTTDGFNFGNYWRFESYIGKVIKGGLGACGGMAFAALDYHRSGQPTPHAPDITRYPGKINGARSLRRYIWRRQWASFIPNGLTFIGWMIRLHLWPGGKQKLAEWTQLEWEKLKTLIDAGQEIPLGLIGSTINPFINHQVLAYGYDEPGTIYLYDMNCGNIESIIQIDIKTEGIQASETCGMTQRGALCGFFCEQYQPQTNVPQNLQWNIIEEDADG